MIVVCVGWNFRTKVFGEGGCDSLRGLEVCRGFEFGRLR